MPTCIFRLLPVVLSVALFAAPPATRKPRGGTSIRVPFWIESPEPRTPAEVQVAINGAPRPVKGVLGPEDGLLLLVVLDLTGDLSQADYAREALIEQIAALPESATAGLLRSQDGLHVLLDPGSPPGKAAEVLGGLPVTGFSGLLDTVEAATTLGDRIAASAKVRVAALYVTDSRISNYREDYSNPVVNNSDSRDMSRRFPEGLIREKIRQILTKVRRSQTPLFVAHLDYRSDRLEEAYQTGLIELAAATGGTTEFCRSVADIPRVIQAAFQRIRRHSVAEVELGPKTPRGPIDVRIVADDNVVRHRERFEWSGN